jgi:hypothetical protein
MVCLLERRLARSSPPSHIRTIRYTSPPRPAVRSRGRLLLQHRIPASFVASLKLASLARLVLAAILGAAIGLERELAGKPVGTYTMMDVLGL